MKKILLFPIIITLFAFTSCSPDSGKPEESESPNTTQRTEDRLGSTEVISKDLDFQIEENVDDIDFSKYQMKYGMYGGHEYYGTGYVPSTDEEGNQTDPDECVIYTVTSYPDYSDKEQCVTGITITDPVIKIYGLTINSPQKEIQTTMEQKGYVLQDTESENVVIYKKDNISISFSEKLIRIRADVSNKNGIMF